MAHLAKFLSRQGAAEEAEIWYRRAAETGGTRAMFDLSRFKHEQGATEEAIALILQAAESGDSSAADGSSDFLGELMDVLLDQGRFHEAAAVSVEMARQEELSRPPLVDAGHLKGVPETVGIAVITAAVVPFLQTITAKAGEDGYQAVWPGFCRSARYGGGGRGGGEQWSQGCAGDAGGRTLQRRGRLIASCLSRVGGRRNQAPLILTFLMRGLREGVLPGLVRGRRLRRR